MISCVDVDLQLMKLTIALCILICLATWWDAWRIR